MVYIQIKDNKMNITNNNNECIQYLITYNVYNKITIKNLIKNKMCNIHVE